MMFNHDFSDSSSNDLPPFGFEDLYNGKYNYKSIYPNWDKSTPGDMLLMNNFCVDAKSLRFPNLPKLCFDYNTEHFYQKQHEIESLFLSYMHSN